MLLTILGFLCGVVLSLRFNVLILVPTILLGWMLALVAGLATGVSTTSIALEMAFVAAALQLGYIAGIVFKWALLAVHLRRRRIWAKKSLMSPDSAAVAKS